MDREQRFEAIASLEATELVDVADQILETLEIEVTRGPTVGLLMVRHEEPVERLTFNLVEVTVTEAEVFAGGERGYALIMGRDPERALAGAIVDVAIEINDPNAGYAVDLLHRGLAAQREQWRREWAEVAGTAVRFEEAL